MRQALRILFGCAAATALWTSAAMAAQDPQAGQSVWAMARWSPYAVGAGIGVLSWLCFVLSDHPIGVSTAYARSAGLIEEAVHGRKAVMQRNYFKEYVPKIDWEWMFVAGLLLGAALSALLSGDFRIQAVPHMWAATFGSGWFLRLLVAFCGGILLGIGARWADGCTSGHGISGTLQLVVSSWIAAACFFVGGVIAAHLLYP